MLFDIDGMVKKYTDQVRPHLIRAGDVHQMFMSGVIDRLDRVVDNTNDSNIGTYRRYFDIRNIPKGDITTFANVVDLVDNGEVRVPPSEDWKLEFAYGRAIGGSNTFFLMVNGDDIAAFPGNASSLPNTLALPVIQGGSLIQIMMGTGSATAGKVRLQFEVRRPLSRNQAWSGQSNPVPDRMEPLQEANLELRHAGTFTQGHNIRGEDRVPPDPSDRDM